MDDSLLLLAGVFGYVDGGLGCAQREYHQGAYARVGGVVAWFAVHIG